MHHPVNLIADLAHRMRNFLVSVAIAEEKVEIGVNADVLRDVALPDGSAVIPDVPTSDEAGIRGLYAPGWFALFGPRGVPKEVVAKLNAAMMHALADPKVRQRMSELGLDVVPPAQQSVEALAAFHKAEIEKWWPVIKAANIKVE